MQETDPTVPCWAKQPEKPTYTAEEVGALSQDTLQNGINEALRQAKESGEFDGKDGENGQDYVLTEADKQEIADMVDVGGGETEWTKKTITLREPVSTIAINIPQAKRVLIYAYLVINDLENSLTTGSSLFSVSVNGYAAGYFSEYIRSIGSFARLIDIEKALSKTKLLATSSFDNGYQYSQNKGLVCSGWLQTDGDASETINEIAFKLTDTKYVFPTHCSLEVYYK